MGDLADCIVIMTRSNSAHHITINTKID